MASLPLRIRYGALFALTTAVEWSVAYLAPRAKDKIGAKPEGKNGTVHALEILAGRAELDSNSSI
jgi:hypothetical protein